MMLAHDPFAFGLQKARPIESRAYREAARGQSCTLRLAGCRDDRSTVVLCHLRHLGGGGTGSKPSDIEGVDACGNCHGILDGPRSQWPVDMHESIGRAWAETLRRRVQAGLLSVKGAR